MTPEQFKELIEVLYAIYNGVIWIAVICSIKFFQQLIFAIWEERSKR